MSDQQTQPPASSDDATGDFIYNVAKGVGIIVLVLVALPLAVPLIASRVGGEAIATKWRFWVVPRWLKPAATVGTVLWVGLLTVEISLVTVWVKNGEAAAFVDQPDWWDQLWPALIPWLAINLASGALLLPLTWILRRRRIARLVRTRRISDVVRQERIEKARKRAADVTTASRIGLQVDQETGRIVGSNDRAITAPHKVGDAYAFGAVSKDTVSSYAERFSDLRKVPDWVSDDGGYVIVPRAASATRALLIAESGTGKTMLLNGQIMSALQMGWPVVFIDAKGDPEDARQIVALAQSMGHTAAAGGKWNLFSGTPAQITAKLLRLLPQTTGDGRHYRDEIYLCLNAIQGLAPLTSVDDLYDRLYNPTRHAAKQRDAEVVNREVSKGETAGMRAWKALAAGVIDLEPWIGEDGWTYEKPLADLTVVSLAPIDEAQAKLGDLLLFDFRNYLASRLRDGIKTPALLVVDEFPQLVADNSDPGDTATSLYETCRSAGMGLILATQSAAGVSKDETIRRRALTSGAALIIGRSKDPEDVVSLAGTVMQLEASGKATGEELGSGRAQHTFVVRPQEVREASMGSFWIIQAGAVSPFRALSNANVDPTKIAGVAVTGTTPPAPQLPVEKLEDATVTVPPLEENPAPPV